jgi:glycine/D-amino acid oxidase-like deaminating enzyme
MGIEAIHRLQKLAGSDCGFRFRPSFQIATRKSDLAGLRKEYAARRAITLQSAVAAEMDPYSFTHRLIRLASARGLRVFDWTTALHYENTKTRVTVVTDPGTRVTYLSAGSA